MSAKEQNAIRLSGAAFARSCNSKAEINPNRHEDYHFSVSLKNAIERRTRRGRSYIDRRIREGQDALRLQAGLVEDMGGLENMWPSRSSA
jgi:hypothetical protein